MKNEEHRNRPVLTIYQPIQIIEDGDTRTIEERLSVLPFVRDEDFPEWESWWKKTFAGLSHNVPNNR